MKLGLRRSSAIVWSATGVLLLALVVTASWLVRSERRDASACDHGAAEDEGEEQGRRPHEDMPACAH